MKRFLKKIWSFSLHHLLVIVVCSFISLGACAQNKKFKPGEIWNDMDGNPINAHGGGFLHHGGKYYWFGEIKKGETRRVEYLTSWECFRTEAGGVSCYSSENLVDWKFEGVALASDSTNQYHDLHTSKVIERPKVIYNEKTNKFVMWLHVDTEDYLYASTGVAISDKPEGPYTYLYGMHPGGQWSRDMTLFKDDDGKAYHIFSSESNVTLHFNLLTDDYLRPSDITKRIFINESREAPAMFKHNGRYYLVTSGCTGWSPNEAILSSADEIMGDWSHVENPCNGSDSDKTFYSQSTYVLPIQGKANAYIYMGDRWNKTDLEDSRYIWLPMTIENEKFGIDWKDSWDLEFFD
jgi:beta-galactosidase